MANTAQSGGTTARLIIVTVCPTSARSRLTAETSTAWLTPQMAMTKVSSATAVAPDFWRSRQMRDATTAARAPENRSGTV
jgi:hypothetical protein